MSVIDKTTIKKFLFFSKFVSSILKSKVCSFFEAIILLQYNFKITYEGGLGGAFLAIKISGIASTLTIELQIIR